MNLYVAGVYTASFTFFSGIFNRLLDVEKKARKDIPWYLESYHYIYKPSMVAKIRRDEIQVFLDSGAYSAFTQGVEVSLPDYCTYIQENEDIILKEDGVVLASVLDAIGDPLKTWQNQKAMERLGVTPLPCFHFGDDERYLEEYIRDYDYITLGGMVATPNKLVRIWLDRIWEKYLTDGSGNARLKVHGFGLMTEAFLDSYPWHSTDSSTWVQNAATGQLLGHTTDGERFPTFTISKDSPASKIHGRHFNTFPPVVQDKFRKDIESRGFDVERLAENYLARWTYNLQIMNELNIKYKDFLKPYKQKQKGLF